MASCVQAVHIMARILAAAAASAAALGVVDAQSGGRGRRTPVTVDWEHTLVTRSAAPSVLVAADPEWTPEGKKLAMGCIGIVHYH